MGQLKYQDCYNYDPNMTYIRGYHITMQIRNVWLIMVIDGTAMRPANCMSFTCHPANRCNADNCVHNGCSRNFCIYHN